jgi:hypothetical protein
LQCDRRFQDANPVIGWSILTTTLINSAKSL